MSFPGLQDRVKNSGLSLTFQDGWHLCEWQIDRAKLRGCHGAFVTLGSYGRVQMGYLG